MDIVHSCKNVQEVYANRACGIRVYFGQHRKYGEVAIKLINCRSDSSLNFYKREGRIAASLNHPSICTVHEQGDYLRDEITQHYIVMEKVHSDLYKEIKKRMTGNRYWSEESIVNMLEQAISALEYAQRKAVCHRDIKPQNILITRKGEIKLADFGSANEGIVRSIVQTLTLQGTPMYLSPELREYYSRPDSERLARPKYNPYKSDVYSLGLTLIHMICLKPPIELSRLHALEEATRQKVAELPVSDTLKDILISMLTVQVDLRMDFEQLREVFASVTYGSIHNQPVLRPLPENYLPSATDPPEPEAGGDIISPPQDSNAVASPARGLPQPQRFELNEDSGRQPPSSQSAAKSPSVSKEEAKSSVSREEAKSSVSREEAKSSVSREPAPAEPAKQRQEVEQVDWDWGSAVFSFPKTPAKSIEPVLRGPSIVPSNPLPPQTPGADDPVDPGPTKCANCFAVLDSNKIELSCGHSICSKECFLELLKLVTKYFRSGFDQVPCPVCGEAIREDVLSNLHYEDQTLRSHVRLLQAEVLCLECRKQRLEYRLQQCSHGFCKGCMGHWQKLALLRREGFILCPACRSELSDDDLGVVVLAANSEEVARR